MIATPRPVVRKWTTDDVAPAQRLDYWVGAVTEGFLEMEVSAVDPARFESCLESANCGAIGVNRVHGKPQDVYRTRRGIARSAESWYYLLCQPETAWSAAQDGRSARLLPTDLVMVDARRCYEFHFPVSVDTVSLELPPGWLESWLVDPAAEVARRIDGQSGWGLALSSFVRQLTPATAVAPPLPPRMLTDQLGALLSLATGASMPGGTVSAGASSALSERVVGIIRERHAEPGLTAPMVAADLCVSARTLHRCLASAGATFACHLTRCRMASASRMLGDARFDRLSVGELGRRAGLSDASHFIRLCRRHLGGTPAELRRGR